MVSIKLHLIPQKLSLAGLVAALCLSAAVRESALADNQQPKNFFQDGYVVQPLPKTATNQGHFPSLNSAAGQGINDVQNPEPPSNPKSTPSSEAGFLTLEDKESPSPNLNESEESLTTLEEEKTIPITAISLALNASAPDETFAMIKKYTDTLQEYNLTPKAIYTMQIPQFIVRDAPTHWASVIVRGGYLEMNREIVEEYGIKRVPTWIANTEEGDVILEGYEDISAFLSSKGELRRSQLRRYAEESKEEGDLLLKDPREVLQASLSGDGKEPHPEVKKAIDELKASLKMPKGEEASLSSPEAPALPKIPEQDQEPTKSPKEMHESHYSVIPKLDPDTDNGEVR